MTAAFALYSLGVTAAVWLLLVPWELVRIASRRSRVRDLRARLGRPPSMHPSPAVRVVVHAVSAGEMTAARALVTALARERPDVAVLLTTGTAAGLIAAGASRALVPQVEQCTWLPWDRLRALRRWLAAVRPAAVVIVETEIWPNLYRACAEQGVPILIASGRVYPDDVARYRAASWFFRPVLDLVRWAGVQDATERDAFERIGMPADRLHVVGNLKCDLPAETVTLPPGVAQGLTGTAAVVVAGSTHHPEERGLITAVRRLRERHPAIVLVIAPRQIDRARAIVRDVERGGLRASLWSEAQAGAPPAWDVLVVDRFGVVAALYAFADIVVMGGTFVSVGGHNLLEPAVQGRPILVGPHCDHVRATACALEAAGALQQVADADDLVDAVDRLIADRVRRMEMGTCARGYVRSHQGAARRCAAAIAEALAGET